VEPVNVVFSVFEARGFDVQSTGRKGSRSGLESIDVRTDVSMSNC
jgi:hypothetical protein